MRRKEIKLMRRISIYLLTFHSLYRSIRNTKLSLFTKPGNPGVKFKNHFEKMLKSLSLPKGAKEELGITEEQAALESDMMNKGKSTEGLKSVENLGGERKATTEMSQPNF